MLTSDYEKSWTEQEDKDLDRLYNVEMLDIMEISKKIPNRSPFTIVKRLLEIKEIKYSNEARGYSVYITTPEFEKYTRELCSGLCGGRGYSN